MKLWGSAAVVKIHQKLYQRFLHPSLLDLCIIEIKRGIVLCWSSSLRRPTAHKNRKLTAGIMPWSLHISTDRQCLHVDDSSQCCGSGMFIPDPNCAIPDPRSRVKKTPDPGSGSVSKNLNILNLTPKIVLGNMILNVHPLFRTDLDFFYPGSRGQKSSITRIRIRNTDSSQ